MFVALSEMTPEEAATRLVRERQGRQGPPRFWRDVFYRIEQSIALFLASLIPGVGERHVRAREERRREDQRIEDERRRAEGEAAEIQDRTGEDVQQVDAASSSDAVPKPQVSPRGPEEPSTSSSVQVNREAAAGEFRNRT